MKSIYKQPIVASFLDEIRLSEVANQREISAQFPAFSEGLDFTRFVSPNTLELLCDLLVTHDPSYTVDNSAHWFNQIRALHVHSITVLVDDYVRERGLGLNSLDSTDIARIAERLDQDIERFCSGLAEIVDKMNESEMDSLHKPLL